MNDADIENPIDVEQVWEIDEECVPEWIKERLMEPLEPLEIVEIEESD